MITPYALGGPTDASRARGAKLAEHLERLPRTWAVAAAMVWAAAKAAPDGYTLLTVNPAM
jgi:hypothetical protein